MGEISMDRTGYYQLWLGGSLVAFGMAAGHNPHARSFDIDAATQAVAAQAGKPGRPGLSLEIRSREVRHEGSGWGVWNVWLGTGAAQ